MKNDGGQIYSYYSEYLYTVVLVVSLINKARHVGVFPFNTKKKRRVTKTAQWTYWMI